MKSYSITQATNELQQLVDAQSVVEIQGAASSSVLVPKEKFEILEDFLFHGKFSNSGLEESSSFATIQHELGRLLHSAK